MIAESSMVKGEVPLRGRLWGDLDPAGSLVPACWECGAAVTHIRRLQCTSSALQSRLRLQQMGWFECLYSAWGKSPSSSHLASPPPPPLPHKWCAGRGGCGVCTHSWVDCFSQSFFQGSLVFCFLITSSSVPCSPLSKGNHAKTVQSILSLCLWWPWVGQEGFCHARL